MRTLEPTDLAFFETSSHRIVARARVSARPERVFASFAEPSEWTTWFPLLQRAAWISGKGGVGAEREVHMGAGLGVYRERFIAWDEGARFSFTMFETTSPLVEQLAEDYRLTPDGDGTQIDWVMAGRPSGMGRVVWPLTRLMMSRFFRRGGKNLEAHLRAG